MSRFLVTGGAGFIGSHLVDALIARRHDVVVLDDLSTGKQEQVNPKAQFVLGSLLDKEKIFSLMANIDGCFHLAAIASSALSYDAWLLTHEVNLSGTIILLDAIKQSRKKIPMIYASSAAIYGDSTSPLLHEKQFPTPLTPYGCDKFGCELHASVATKLYQIPTVGLRLFNVYGPRQDPLSPYAGVISLFAQQILMQKTLTIYGDGEQSRDFIYVADVVKAFMAAMEQSQTSPLVMNVCRGQQTTLNQLIDTLEEITGLTAERCYAPMRAADVLFSKGDPALIKQSLNVSCEITLIEGLRKTLEYLRK